MNILASYNWIKEYLDTDLSPEKFAELTTAAGNSVETSDYLAKKFDRMVVGLVKEIKSHPDADLLKVVSTDVGSSVAQIVCGGVNLEEGMLVAVALSGAKVKWHGEGDLVELKDTKIRGVKSEGMICAAEEIGFEKLEQGEKEIWNISDLTDSAPGTGLAKALDLDDVIFDIEVTTNRPDCKSIIGQAREGGAVLESPFTWKSSKISEKKGTEGFSLEVKDERLCSKYLGILLENVQVKASPWWLQKKLLLSGFKPINNLVDITNYILHEYGQPLHTFDADKLAGQKVVVRKAKQGEKFLALDGNEYELSKEQLVIADEKRVVAVAGVMGGEETGTTEETTRVFIECATFDPVSVRRTSRALNLYSDSQLLFEKGLSTESTLPALARAVELIEELAGGKVTTEIFKHETSDYEALSFPFDPDAANRLMGIELSFKEMKGILERLGFTVKKDSVNVPYWRDHDIEASVDFVEEIARIYGYDKFPAQLPGGELSLVKQDPGLVWERKIKSFLAGAGFTEAYSFAFLSKQQLDGYLIESNDAIKLKNPLSMDQEYMRPSLVPSMLTSIEENQKRFTEARLFEIAPVYIPKKDDKPDEPYRLVLGLYGKDPQALFFEAKGSLERMLRESGVREWSFDRNTDERFWHAGRSARILVEGKSVGVIGQVSRRVASSFGLDVGAVLVEVDVDGLLGDFNIVKSFVPIAQFPEVKRDIAFVLDERVEFGDVETVVRVASELLRDVDLFDVYQGKGVEEGKKSMAMHLSFRSDDRTLDAVEIDSQMESIVSVLDKEFSATIRS